MSGPKRIGKCLHCQREDKKIIGRGLCGSCYWGIHNGKIDPALYPPLIMPQRANKRKKKNAPVKDVQPNIEVLLLKCMDELMLNMASHEVMVGKAINELMQTIKVHRAVMAEKII